MSTLESQEVKSCNKQKTFVTLLAKFPVLMSKSQLPQVKAKKAGACDQFLEEYQQKSGIQMTKDQLLKKLNNMKSAIKTKADVKKTGNKPIVLTDWEEDFLELLDSERNPAFSKVPGAISVGVAKKRSAASCASNNADEDGDNILAQDDSVGASTSNKIPRPSPPPPPKKSHRVCPELPETEETKDLTTPELQRLVLLEQLQLIRMQQRQINQ